MSTNSSWNGIMKILWIEHRRQGELLWREENIKNILHSGGEAFILNAVFAGGQINSVIPEHYYIGLDARASLAVADTLVDLSGEPSTNGYSRQAINSSGDFVVTLPDGLTNYRATSPIVAFQAVGGDWGPITNIFLCNSANVEGDLIASSALPSALSVADGDTITMRLGLTLKDC